MDQSNSNISEVKLYFLVEPVGRHGSVPAPVVADECIRSILSGTDEKARKELTSLLAETPPTCWQSLSLINLRGPSQAESLLIHYGLTKPKYDA